MPKKRFAIAVAGDSCSAERSPDRCCRVVGNDVKTPVTYTMVFGSSGNLSASSPAGGTAKTGTVGSILPDQCEPYGVGDLIGSTSFPSLLGTPYELTETPVSASSGVLTYFTLTTTNASLCHSYACASGTCHGADPGTHDEGLLDIVGSRGCGTSCPSGSYDPGHVSRSPPP
jgi:hypothetical protein